MNVMNLIRQANPSEVARIYNETYNGEGREDGWGSVDAFNEFKQRVEKIVGIRGGDEQLDVIVQWIDREWESSFDGTKYHDQYFSVGARQISAPETVYSISMTDWGAWKEMEVKDETNKNLSTDELVAHIYYEMTWFGWQEDMVERRDQIADSMEQFTKDFEGLGPNDPLPEGYTELGESLSDLKNKPE